MLYVDPPRTRISAMRKPWLAASNSEPRLRLLSDRLALLTPMVTPAKTRPGSRMLAGAVFRQ